MENKIMVCDDNGIFLEIFKYLFGRENLSVITLPDARELSASARRHKPSLILLDIMMPGKDGLTALRELKEDPSTAAIPVIIVSSVVDNDIVVQARKLGALEFVEKPFNALKLQETVRRHMEAVRD